MKKICTALLVGLSTTLVNAAGYGVIDIERVVEQSTYLKQQNAALQQRVKPQSTQLETLGKQLEALQQRAQQGAKLSDAERQKLAAEYQAKMQEFNQVQQVVQSTVQSNIQQMNKTMEGRVKQVAEQLRQENKLDVILNKNSALAYDPKSDLTDKMIQKVNAIK
jgi:outer membrane protein